MEIRKITPPKLDNAHLGEKILCYRPRRTCGARLAVEQVDNKIIAHNYGHGGGGWTLGPGTAKHLIDLLQTSQCNQTLYSNTPITILGAGAIGLLSAYEFIQRGYKNITIIAREFDNLPSHTAGGAFSYICRNKNPEIRKLYRDIGAASYRFYADIANQKNQELAGGAQFITSYFPNREESGLEQLVGAEVQNPKDVIIDFGTGVTRPMVSYDDGIFIHTNVMMQLLTQYVQQYATFVRETITSFDQISDNHIINCAGLGAQQLCNDRSMVSVQGHLIQLKNQIPADLNYTIFVHLDVGKTAAGQNIQRLFCIFPKKSLNGQVNDIGIIGGSLVQGATNTTRNEQEFDTVIQNAKKFFGL